MSAKFLNIKSTMEIPWIAPRNPPTPTLAYEKSEIGVRFGNPWIRKSIQKRSYHSRSSISRKACDKQPFQPSRQSKADIRDAFFATLGT